MTKSGTKLKQTKKLALVKDYRAGHRERLRARFRKGGADSLAPHELLELILFRAIPRGDVKDMAKEMLHRFGSLAAIVATPDHLLAEVPNVGPRVIDEIRVVRAAAIEIARNRIHKRPLLASHDMVINYCMTIMGHESVEQFRAFYLDTKHYLIVDEVIQRGTVDRTHIYPRELLKRAAALDAHGVILAHNHPSGDPMPSREDIALTRELADLLRAAGIVLYDHVIVGRGRCISLKNQGAF